MPLGMRRCKAAPSTCQGANVGNTGL